MEGGVDCRSGIRLSLSSRLSLSRAPLSLSTPDWLAGHRQLTLRPPAARHLCHHHHPPLSLLLHLWAPTTSPPLSHRCSPSMVSGHHQSPEAVVAQPPSSPPSSASAQPAAESATVLGEFYFCSIFVRRDCKISDLFELGYEFKVGFLSLLNYSVVAWLIDDEFAFESLWV